MKSDDTEFKPQDFEAKWQKIWLENSTYQPEFKSAANPFYNLMMFPYPSAEGLHVGNMYAFTGSDIYGRLKRMQGFDVIEPIGLDGFGIHSENYAMKIGEHPADLSKKTEQNFYRQLHLIGNGFSWKNKLETYDPNYYKWTQWIFIELFKAGLVYRGEGEVNWCPSCLTVLADEQVIAKEDKQLCERCGSEVSKKKLTQWYFKITEYAQKLLGALDKLDWSEKVKLAQKNWLGKSEGAEVVFQIDIDKEYSVPIFTTRVDTIFGVTFLALAVDHELVTTILSVSKGPEKQAIREILDYSSKNLNAKTAKDEKSGVFTGFFAMNPANGEKIPVYIADYVLTGYGTGAVMGVPAHDQRDWDFAKKYGVEIKSVIKADKEDDVSREAFTSYGELINSGKYDGMNFKDGVAAIIADFEKSGKGKSAINWHLRDWIISRQRYWGPPIPMIYCEKCASQGKSWFTQNRKEALANNWKSEGWYPVDENDLPVELPYVEEFKPTGSGISPLARDEKFVNVKCPGCGQGAKRETDVSDTFLDSAWYFLRYPSVDIQSKAWDLEITKKWLPVDMYIGGAEHSVLHLLYSRFVTKVFFDLGLVDFEEPFTKFRAHGLLIKDGAKMSKSKGNVINPDDYIAKFGADTLRAYLMFCGRYSEGGDFRDEGIEGMHKFLKRVWKLVINRGPVDGESSAESLYMMHKTIKKVTEDIENLSYNTAIASMMEWMNFLEDQKIISQIEIKNLLKLLAPFAPHMSEELWQVGESGDFKSVHLEKWPEFDAKLAISEKAVLVVQVNGRLRDKLEVERGLSEEWARDLALKSENVSKYITSGDDVKVVYVQDKLINFVAASGKK